MTTSKPDDIDVKTRLTKHSPASTPRMLRKRNLSDIIESYSM